MFRKYQTVSDVEILSGQFQGKVASDDEERFLTEAQRIARRVWFKFILGVKNHPGWLELDALVQTIYGWRAFEIDDMSFVHKGIREASETKLKDIRRITMLGDLGIGLYKNEIEHVNADKLQNREQAATTVRGLLR